MSRIFGLNMFGKTEVFTNISVQSTNTNIFSLIHSQSNTCKKNQAKMSADGYDNTGSTAGAMHGLIIEMKWAKYVCTLQTHRDSVVESSRKWEASVCEKDGNNYIPLILYNYLLSIWYYLYTD